MEEKKKKKSSKSKARRKILFTVATVVMLGIFATSAYAIASNNRVKQWEDKIYPNSRNA